MATEMTTAGGGGPEGRALAQAIPVGVVVVDGGAEAAVGGDPEGRAIGPVMSIPAGGVVIDDAVREADFLWELRKYVLLLATLAATVTYSAGLNPPGGFWGDNDGERLAGDPVLRVTYPARYKVFFYCNATAFVASLVIVNLLLVH